MKNAETYITSILSRLYRALGRKRIELRGLGVYLYKRFVYLYFFSQNDDESFYVARSSDGFNFELYRKNAVIQKYFSKKEKIETCSDFEIIKIKKRHFLFYKKRSRLKIKWCTATSTDLLRFEYMSTISPSFENGVMVPEYVRKKNYVLYRGGKSISIVYSKNFLEWDSGENVLLPRPNSFDSGSLEVEHIMNTEKGIVLFYSSQETRNGFPYYKVGVALCDKENPSTVLWRSNEPLWEQPEEWIKKKVYPIGMVNLKGKIIAYWGIHNEGVFAVIYSHFRLGDGIQTKSVSLHLKRSEHNPIITPKSENYWEAFNTFNPAAVYESGKVHLVYRAQGYDYISVLGYASSKDGVHIDKRHQEPVFLATAPFEYTESIKQQHISYRYVSGGGYGGCEDPRLTKIDDRLYMTYVAFDGVNPPRVALTSIALEDFLNNRWLWERPVLISPPGVVDKNAVIFPEKIQNKYVILHRIYPDILIDFVDNLNFDGTCWLKGEYKISPRADKWDSRKIGAGAPPIKTKDGWLLIYQSVGNQDPGRYKIGAMLLDLDDPTKVLHRSNAPILEPTERYENEGFKTGVAYPCGAVVINGTLFVYYGAADSYVCVATANLDHFLSELKYSEISKVEPAVIRKVI